MITAMIPALTIIFVALIWGYTLYLLNEARIDAEKREHHTRMELYSVLGRDETVSIALRDERPAGQIRYVDDAKALKIQKQGVTANGS